MTLSLFSKANLVAERVLFNLSSYAPAHLSHSLFISTCSVRHESQNNDSGDKPIKKGIIVEKAPVRVFCEEGKLYSWCACGLSKKQPLCDGAHKKSSSGLKPVRFTAPKTKEYFLCNCKQTDKQPFCDGTHKKL